MTKKRDPLELLTRDELLVERFELSVSGRRAKAGPVDAVESSKRAPLPEGLAYPSRYRLKELCRAPDLDDSGREKAVLVERLSRGELVHAAPTTKEAKSNGANASAPLRIRNRLYCWASQS